MRVVVIGGGAAGIFSAIACAIHHPHAEVSLFEKSFKLLSKVKISGGGRCNVTHACFENYELVKNYPRGSAELKKLFSNFSVKDTVSFFESRGVKLKVEKDGRMFPESDDSQTIIDCLIKEARVHGVRIMTEFGVKTLIQKEDGTFQITVKSGGSLIFERIVVATGGNPNEGSYQWLKDLGHNIIKPVPSLFTFNIPNSRLNGLQGISIKDAVVKIQGGQQERGPLLITHWGLSGPAILRLSAWSARKIFEDEYEFNLTLSFIPEHTEEMLRKELLEFKAENPKKLITSNPLYNLSKRLWERLSMLVGVEEDTKWGDVSNRIVNKLIEELIRGSYKVKGKTSFKEEFVTCGGVSLSDVDLNTLESKKCKGLYFAGEVLDIDGITGGFNFQAAWTTGWIAGKSAATLKNTLVEVKSKK